MRPHLTWALKEVDPIGLHRQSIIMSGITPQQNPFKSKIAPHKEKSIVNLFGRKMTPPPPALSQQDPGRKMTPPDQRDPVLKNT